MQGQFTSLRRGWTIFGLWKQWIKLTSNISDAENANRTSIKNTTLVGQERNCTRSWDSRRRATSAVGHVATGVVIVARGLLIRLGM